MVQFNDKYIWALQPKDKKYLVVESKGERKGGRFAVQVSQNGKKHFFFVYYWQGKRKLLSIGEYGRKENGKLSLAEARQKYIEQGRVLNDGYDPKEYIAEQEAERERERIAKAEALRREQAQGSFGQLLEFYLDHLRANKSERHYKNVRYAIEHENIGVLLNIKANQITEEDIKPILQRIVDRGALVMAERMRVYLSAAFNLAIKSKNKIQTFQRQSNVEFGVKYNPVAIIPKIDEHISSARDRYLSEDEVYIFWRYLDKSGAHISTRLAMQFMLATGQRVEQCLTLEWSDIKSDLWECPAEKTKNGRPNVIPLNSLALSILEQMPHFGSHVFFGSKPYKRLATNSPNQALSRMIPDIGLEHFVAKDLRRTFKTLAGKAGLSKDIRDKIQDHAQNDVSSAHYDRYDYLNEKRAAMNQWGDYLSRIISGAEQDNVVQFRKEALVVDATFATRSATAHE
jgi:integrase